MDDNKIFMIGLTKIKEGILSNSWPKVLEGYHMIIGENLDKTEVNLTSLREMIKSNEKTEELNDETQKEPEAEETPKPKTARGRKTKKPGKKVKKETTVKQSTVKTEEIKEIEDEENITPVQKVVKTKNKDGPQKLVIISTPEDPIEKKKNERLYRKRSKVVVPRAEKIRDNSTDENAGVRFYDKPPKLK